MALSRVKKYVGLKYFTKVITIRHGKYLRELMSTKVKYIGAAKLPKAVTCYLLGDPEPCP